MSSEIKPGDVVRLKSGGPKMTVQKIGEYMAVGHGAQCVWFDGNKESTKVFGLAALAKDE